MEFIIQIYLHQQSIIIPNVKRYGSEASMKSNSNFGVFSHQISGKLHITTLFYRRVWRRPLFHFYLVWMGDSVTPTTTTLTTLFAQMIMSPNCITQTIYMLSRRHGKPPHHAYTQNIKNRNCIWLVGLVSAATVTPDQHKICCRLPRRIHRKLTESVGFPNKTIHTIFERNLHANTTLL